MLICFPVIPICCQFVKCRNLHMCTYIAASLSDSTDEGWDLLAGTEISDAWCEKSQNIKYCADGRQKSVVQTLPPATVPHPLFVLCLQVSSLIFENIYKSLSISLFLGRFTFSSSSVSTSSTTEENHKSKGIFTSSWKMRVLFALFLVGCVCGVPQGLWVRVSIICFWKYYRSKARF